MNVQIKVRVQARGGKFLGPNVKAPTLVVTDSAGTPLFKGTFDNSASGTVVATPSSASSRNGIVVQAPLSGSEAYPAFGAYALNPPAEGAELIAQFDVLEAMAVTFVVTAYSNSGAALVTSTSMQVAPGLTLLDDPGFVITIPGLSVSDVSAVYEGTVLFVKATVAMMCGCPITPQPWSTNPPTTEPYWPSYAFKVMAGIAGQQSFELTCTGNNTFTGSAGMTLGIGVYTVTVVATQPAEANAGFASGSVSVG